MPAPIDDAAVSARVRAELHRLGMSQRELGRRLGESHGWVQRRIGGAEPESQGDRPPWMVRDVGLVARALGVSAEWLLTGRNPTP